MTLKINYLNKKTRLSNENLAFYRGSSVGIKAAEAFQLLREIKKNT